MKRICLYLIILALIFSGCSSKEAEVAKISEDMTNKALPHFTQARIDKFKEDCQTLCDAASSDEGAVDFCKKTTKIDYNGDMAILSKIEINGYETCEDFIPCFIFIPIAKF